MEEINRLHDIADDIGSTSWGYELASALHNIAAGIEEKVDEMRHVIAAGGEPLEVGQKVWGVEDGKEFEVVNVNGELPLLKYGETAYTATEPEHLTHQRPVFDADGVPIYEGDTVWLVDQFDSDWKFTVANVLAPNEHSDGKWSVKIKSDWGVFTYREPSQITHAKPEPPDSWEKVEKDADLKPRGYVDLVLGWDMSKDHSENQARRAMTHDLVRRCKEVARKENNNE